ncbi:hypothetical protein BCR36DRAFT_467685 [Piromyces finnis]|uniref:Uncharacterized protein n=1 Tax=Piromyces finnis TaxID=1754191 RepID=A0A1Y1UU63_9FUNG|nr:hypothetical protein BCR36DRAFT_467685 [Piromyces finnis]|eukprot:ORX41564.1 hypothetical protein BCR36DRAFT_467685 [Piromyces finnis]
MFIKKNFNNLYFVKKYLKEYNELEKILSDPEYILSQNIEICINEYYVMLFCCSISMIHNNFNYFIIKALLYNIFDSSYFDVLDKKLVFFKYTCEEPYIRKIFNILCSTPHEVFNNYILIKDYNPN